MCIQADGLLDVSRSERDNSVQTLTATSIDYGGQHSHILKLLSADSSDTDLYNFIAAGTTTSDASLTYAFAVRGDGKITTDGGLRVREGTHVHAVPVPVCASCTSVDLLCDAVVNCVVGHTHCSPQHVERHLCASRTPTYTPFCAPPGGVTVNSGDVMIDSNAGNVTIGENVDVYLQDSTLTLEGNTSGIVVQSSGAHRQSGISLQKSADSTDDYTFLEIINDYDSTPSKIVKIDATPSFQILQVRVGVQRDVRCVQ